MSLALQTILLLLTVVLAGCTSTLPLDPDYDGPAPLPEERRAQFRAIWDLQPKDVSVQLIKERSRYDLKEVRFSSLYNPSGIEHEIILTYYDVHETESSPVVMVLPILGGGDEIATYIARSLAGKGYAAAIVHRQDSYKDQVTPDNANDLLEQTIYDNQQALNWLLNQPGNDSSRVAAFGISFGGIKAALFASLDERIKASVLCLASGDLARLFATTNEKGVREMRARFMEEQGMTLEELEEHLKKQIVWDPLYFAPHLDARNVLMVMATRDKTVPYPMAQDLRREIGNPRAIEVFADHYLCVLYTPWIIRRARHFFEERFSSGMDPMIHAK